MKKRQVVRKLISAGICASVLAGAAATPGISGVARAQYGTAPLSVLLDGRLLRFDVAPTEVNGRVLVPLRGVFEALGATVDFDPSTNNIFAVRGDTQVQLRLGSTEANVNGTVTPLDVPAQTRLGRTLVPLRFVSEALGAHVNWNAAQQAVFITTQATGAVTVPVAPVVDSHSVERANRRQLEANLAQVRLLVSQYRDDHNGQAPASVAELRRYAPDVPASVWISPVDGTPLIYDANLGTIYAEGQVPPAEPVRNPATPVSRENTLVSLTGTVRNVREQARTFDLTMHDGSQETVEVSSALPAQLSAGDVVQVTGRVRGDVVRADLDQLIFMQNTRRLQFDGTVESILDNNRLVVQNENGQRYTLRTRDAIPANINVGDMVHADGQWDGTNYTAGRVTLTDARAVAPRATRLQFDATVISILDNNRLVLENANGVRYTLRTRDAIPAEINVGDAVRADGQWDGTNYVGGTVTLLRSGAAVPRATRLQFDGTVESILDNNRLVVQNANGSRYTLHTRDAIPADINVGDTVHADGTWDGTNYVNGKVTLVGAGAITAAGQAVDFLGTVDTVDAPARSLSVRGDNGQIYTLTFRNAGDFVQGDRVRVVGTFADGVTIATAITRQ